MTSFAEQKVHLPGCGSSGVKWDEKAKGFKEEVKDFEVKLPQSAEDLEMRLKILEHVWAMVKMRYGSNPKLASVASVHFARYTEWLKGTQVWNFCIKGKDGAPISCPTIGLILDYDLALRTRQAKLLNLGFDFQDALETGDGGRRPPAPALHGSFHVLGEHPRVSGPFSAGNRAHLPAAAESQEGPRVFRQPGLLHTQVADSPLSKTARKRANQAAKKREAEQEAARAAKAAKKNHKGESKGSIARAQPKGRQGPGPSSWFEPASARQELADRLRPADLFCLQQGLLHPRGQVQVRARVLGSFVKGGSRLTPAAGGAGTCIAEFDNSWIGHLAVCNPDRFTTSFANAASRCVA